MRTLGMRRVAEREARELVAAAARTLATPTRPGINAAIDERRARCRSSSSSCASSPSRGPRSTCSPPPKLLAFGLSTNWEMELLRAAARARRRARAGGEARAAVSARQPDRHRARRRATRATATTSPRRSRACASRSACGMHATGSNNWVVSGERSVTGTPLLACDPHLTLHDPGPLVRGRPRLRRLPRARRDAPDQPLPGVRADRRTAAWGFTNVMADTQDLFVERLNPDERGCYEFEGGWREPRWCARRSRSRAARRPRCSTCTVTHHGPIVNDVLGRRTSSRSRCRGRGSSTRC